MKNPSANQGLSLTGEFSTLEIAAAGPRLAGLLPMVLATLAVWRCRSRTRRHLMRLDAGNLDDAGLTRAQQRAEAGKWFWQA